MREYSQHSFTTRTSFISLLTISLCLLPKTAPHKLSVGRRRSRRASHIFLACVVATVSMQTLLLVTVLKFAVECVSACTMNSTPRFHSINKLISIQFNYIATKIKVLLLKFRSDFILRSREYKSLILLFLFRWRHTSVYNAIVQLSVLSSSLSLSLLPGI